MIARLCRCADLIVVRVMAGRDLERAGAKFAIHVFVGDDRNLAVEDRHESRLADQMPGSARLRDAPPPPYRPGSFRGGSSPPG